MRDAVFTVSPNRQYRGILRPTTPAQTGPETYNMHLLIKRTVPRQSYRQPHRHKLALKHTICTFTPNRQYRGILQPTTSAQTGPERSVCLFVCFCLFIAARAICSSAIKITTQRLSVEVSKWVVEHLLYTMGVGGLSTVWCPTREYIHTWGSWLE
jgi:hypothetical protein